MSIVVAATAVKNFRTPEPIHSHLRRATRDVHERLHSHDGFASIKDGSVTLADYRRLLSRLYGFYVPFEVAASLESERSVWLADDLQVLGFDRVALTALPHCTDVPTLHDGARQLGALYVVEGSTLGGRDLFTGLDRLFGTDGIDARRFFFGRGAATVGVWKEYLARLSRSSSTLAQSTTIADAAIETFVCFENWLAGWNETTHESN